jgi:hypothetical protein
MDANDILAIDIDDNGAILLADSPTTSFDGSIVFAIKADRSEAIVWDWHHITGLTNGKYFSADRGFGRTDDGFIAAVYYARIEYDRRLA